MAHGQGASIQRRTDHGKRAHGKDKNTKKAEQRERDPRYQDAMDEVRKQRKALDEIIAAQTVNPAMGATPGAEFARRQAELALEKAEEAETHIALQMCMKCQEQPRDSASVWCETCRVEVLAIHAETEADQAKQRIVRHKPEEVTAERIKVYYVHTIDPQELPQNGDGHWRFSYQTAVIMLKEGYNIKRVIEYTGIGYEDLAHIEIDSEGYVVAEDDGVET